MKKQNQFYECSAYRFKRFVRKAYSAFNSMHKVVTIGVITGAMLTFAHATSTSAQTAAQQTPEKLLEDELEEVSVTASRIETPVNQTARLVTVITDRQIEQAPVQSIQDLFVYAANMDVVQRGRHGVQADLSIRGGTFDQNAVLLNGVNLSNPHTGHYSFDIPVNLSDIERIEIIHGPSALIYGAGAFSGGINIITKKKTDARASAGVESGMHGLRGMEVRGAVKNGIAFNSLSVGYNASEGYIANSDYDIYQVLWQTCMRLANGSKIDIQSGYNDKKYGANTFYSAKYPNQYEHTRTYTGSVKGSFGSKLNIIPIIYWHRHHDQFDLVKDTDFGRNFHRNDTYGGNLIFNYRSKFGITSLGGELRKEDIISSVLGKPMANPQGKYKMYDDRINAGIALEHTVNMEKLVLSAGMLMNHNSLQSGSCKFYPSVNVTYRPAGNLNLSSSWSKSTRMPTFTDLYYTTETHDGNDGLKPEKSESLEFNIKYKNTVVSAYLTGFMLWGSNMIDWVKATDKWASWNLTKVNTQGVETGLKIRLAEMLPLLGAQSFISLDYTRMHQSSDTKGLLSLYSLNYLRNKFTAQFHHRIGKSLTAGWYFRFQKRMGLYEKYENLEKVADVSYPAFSTLDLKMNYTYNDISFNVSLNNLYDTYYFDKGNIPQPGFWLTGGISYSFR
ncbi:MAG: TonB-dependent receptor [Tannerella sp.]|jgi:iron complex outermembrane receptor protein|nr:TonB-dependent receptor [Tannerella sp.]